ncbi:hypothetical protein [Singulisphaera acidiphila]|uniref:Uncharacterized protein n=1 Tax=Singulisphaera acidiphila (strain ATCC BAA-1392 / DSM 18658 / VKM B-2454 / MOB10) TaxID=886293 RepID=L0D8Q6_SINAD|nr:hypothetical protein [Singulisphaera acidiphila]AGA25016.1 hypothetical protein Sinac_0594 [Singulisphaera acidiphila DSM 18658]
MRLSVWYKVAVLVILGVSTSLFTSSLLRQSKARVVTSKNASKSGLTFTPFTVDAQSQLQSVEVQANKNHVTVKGSAVLYDKRPSSRYLWSLLVKSKATNEVVLQNQYDHQIFAVEPNVPNNPTFREDLMLDPGLYQVELRLYRVTAKTDLRKLREDAKHDKIVGHPQLVVAGTRAISVVE